VGEGVVALANTTYARMAETTTRVLDALVAAKLARRPVVAAPTALVRAGTDLFQLLTNWNDETAAALFADSVAPDEPFAERHRQAAAFFERVGSCRLARVDAETNASGTIVVQSAAAEYAIWFALAPHAGLVQDYGLPD
jgi:hypothetical protein